MQLSLEQILAQYDESNGAEESTCIEVARLRSLGDPCETWGVITVSEFSTWRCVGTSMVKRTMALKRGQQRYIHGGYTVRMLGTPKASVSPPGITVDPAADRVLRELEIIRAMLERIAGRIAPEEAPPC